MLDAPIPEIQRTNLANTVLTLKALGINDLLNFDFMDRPSESAMIAAMYQLYCLEALDDEGTLTRLGIPSFLFTPFLYFLFKLIYVPMWRSFLFSMMTSLL